MLYALASQRTHLPKLALVHAPQMAFNCHSSSIVFPTDFSHFVRKKQQLQLQQLNCLSASHSRSSALVCLLLFYLCYMYVCFCC